tara:strand:+ start:386 stop:574 length:189 start_codon:yes stop_codon:yes gene_type:complete
MYKNISWNTGAAAERFRAKRKHKSEPPVDHKLVHKLHDAWARANGYKLQAASSKRHKKDTIK